MTQGNHAIWIAKLLQSSIFPVAHLSWTSCHAFTVRNSSAPSPHCTHTAHYSLNDSLVHSFVYRTETKMFLSLPRGSYGSHSDPIISQEWGGEADSSGDVEKLIRYSQCKWDSTWPSMGCSSVVFALWHWKSSISIETTSLLLEAVCIMCLILCLSQTQRHAVGVGFVKVKATPLLGIQVTSSKSMTKWYGSDDMGAYDIQWQNSRDSASSWQSFASSLSVARSVVSLLPSAL